MALEASVQDQQSILWTAWPVGQDWAFMALLPMQFGGLGCRWLALRANLGFLRPAMQLSCLRSGLCRAVGDEIWVQELADLCEVAGMLQAGEDEWIRWWIGALGFGMAGRGGHGRRSLIAGQ